MPLDRQRGLSQVKSNGIMKNYGQEKRKSTAQFTENDWDKK